MAGSKVNDYGIGDQNIESVMLTLDAQRYGYHALSITNFETTTAPQIAAGSVMEIGGSLYKFSSNETITGSPSDGMVYIYLVPGGSSVTATYTNTAPTWSDSKQGWYGTGGSANYRYVHYKVVKSGASYTKYFIDEKTSIFAYNSDASVQNIAYSSLPETISFNAESHDLFGEFNTSTNRFTALESGIYEIYANVTLNTYGIGNRYGFISIVKNGSTLLSYSAQPLPQDAIPTTTDVVSIVSSVTVQLEASDYIYISVDDCNTLSSGSYQIFASGLTSYISGIPTYIKINRIANRRMQF